METLQTPPPEGEPENVTPTAPIHFDAGRLDQLAACGYDLDRNGPEGWTTDRAKVTCAACVSTLVDEQLAVPTPAPERRTVSLEVLTDELLALAAVEYVGTDADLLTRAKVGIVGRIGGRADAVTDVDRDWHASSGADVLANLIRQAQGRAFNASAELLMPTPDVLAALAGQPDLQPWTAPISVRALQVQVGWLAVDFTREGADDLVTAVGDCEDETCPWTGDCAPISCGTEPVHFATWQGVTVRIPAGPVTR